MTGRVAAVALLAWLIGLLVLGLHWEGHERAPGVWVDGVSLTQWVACWGLLALLAIGTGRYLRGWPVRVLALLPLVGWIAWELSGSSLGPIPMIVYLIPTLLVWCAGLIVGKPVRRALARSVNDS
jgi:hypothetical protein